MKPRLRNVGLGLLLAISSMLIVTSVSRGVAQPQIDSSGAAKIDRWVIDHTTGDQPAEFLVILNDQADLSAADRLTTKAAKGRYVYETLYNTAQRSQRSIVTWLLPNASLPFDAARRARVELSGRLPSRRHLPAMARLARRGTRQSSGASAGAPVRSW